MKQTKKLLMLIVAGFIASFGGWAQTNKSAQWLANYGNYVFSEDSITGFDEESAKVVALSEGYVGSEFKIKMFLMKRAFVNAKYGIAPKKAAFSQSLIAKTSVAPACTNEDFEAAAAGFVTTSNQVNGWTVTSGQALGGFNSCNLPALTNNPLASEVISCNPTTGYVDPVIGGCYPIYSVFGSTPNNGNSVNPTLPAMGGNIVFRLNNETTGDYGIEKLSKTFNVTASNALFQFAFISVFYPGHTCCSAGAFQIKLINASTSQTLTCPSFSVSAPSTQCVGSGTNVSYFIGGGSCPPNTSSNFNPIFNKWNFNSLDLSAYLGQNITIEVIASDCDAGGHYGCVYFDAQCSPMTIIGNGNGFPAGTPNITLPTCGASGATITAPTGLGPYSWTSSQISIPANLTVPSNTNITLVTNQSGTVQLSMNPPGSCAPITKVITVTITPAPVVFASATQANCTNTLSAASLTTAGSASVNPTITWSPTPASIGSGSMTATGLPVGITTITVLDNTGCQATATVNILPTPPPVTFSVNNATGSSSITCTYPTINMNTTSSYTYGTITYTWTSPSFSATGNSVTLNTQGSYLVCGMDAATTCSSCQTFTIFQNTTAPTTSVNPLTQAITCSLSGTATFSSTCLSPSVNIVHNWYTPLSPPPGPAAASSNNTLSPFVASSGPGTYSVIVTNLTNGCSTTKTVNITSLMAYPAFNISSPTNFTVGCAPSHNTTTLSIINPTTTGGVQYAFLPPSFTGTTVTFGGTPSTITAVPGTWTLMVNDPNNNCTTALPVIVLQNTVQPFVDVTMLTQTLTCFNPTVLATATSSTPGTQITWNVPSTPPTLSTPSVIIGPPTGPNTSTNSLTYANYTVVATNTVNGCVTTSLVVINQNFKAPNPILAAAGSPSVINCNGVPVTISFTNAAITSSITGAIAIVQSWMGPSPQASVGATPAYSAYVPGVYTVNVQDSKNGCVGTRTINILDFTQPPVLSNLGATFTLDCGTASAPILIGVTGSTTGIRYLVTEYPNGTQFSPPGIIINPGVSTAAFQADQPGYYEYVVTNTVTGCKTTGSLTVVNGSINADFTPDATQGYAPLTVNFTNNTATSLGTSSIISVWSYGNGSIQTTTTNVNTSTTFNAAGTYTVMLLASRGACVDTAYKVIKVDVPSKLEIPNVFTPNGDGSNDIFFLKTANLSEITATLFDRWGNKVYEVTSTTGNIAWDGKNLEGKECPSGVYFYIIKASGKDSKSYEQKGNVSLYR